MQLIRRLGAVEGVHWGRPVVKRIETAQLVHRDKRVLGSPLRELIPIRALGEAHLRIHFVLIFFLRLVVFLKHRVHF